MLHRVFESCTSRLKVRYDERIQGCVMQVGETRRGSDESGELECSGSVLNKDARPGGAEVLESESTLCTVCGGRASH